MAKPGKKRDTGCPVAFALDTFGDRWTLVIIRDMVFKGYQTYGEFLTAKEGIATNVLAERLKRLDAEGIVTKSPAPENHRKINYSLTEKGCDLLPVILAMVRWSGKYDPNTGIPRRILKRIETDPEEFIAEIRARHYPPPKKARAKPRRK